MDRNGPFEAPIFVTGGADLVYSGAIRLLVTEIDSGIEIVVSNDSLSGIVLLRHAIRHARTRRGDGYTGTNIARPVQSRRDDFAPQGVEIEQRLTSANLFESSD